MATLRVVRPAGLAPVWSGSAMVGPQQAGGNQVDFVRTSRSQSGGLSVVTVSGVIDDNDADELRTRLLDALESADGDVVMDSGQVDTISDPALVAMTAARSRAKFLRHRVAVVDGPDGAVTTALRRTGLRYRFPVYPDVAAACEGLEADRAARRRLTLSA